jgi:sulfoxide reductase heme-binding subunit YedZ
VGIHAFIKSRFFYPLVFAACGIPGVVLAIEFYRAAISGSDPEVLGANPSETLLHTTGRYAVIILICSLAVTPIRRLTGWNAIQKVRRMVGVWSFTYAVLHLTTYLVFNQNCFSWETCNLAGVWDDVVKRKFIFMGMAAFTILLALAVTSTNWMMRRLKRNWGRLHRLVYVAAIAAVVHYAWGQKLNITKPLEWAAVLAVLLGCRVYLSVKKRIPAKARPAR